jgi:small subunit ribosomal protein S20
MPNIKSAKKRAKQNIKKRDVNLARKTAIKTSIKKVVAALEENNIAQAQEMLKEVNAKLSRAKSKHLIHANTAARKMSRLAKKVAGAARTK